MSIITWNLHFSYQRRKQAALAANPDHPSIRNLSDAAAEKRRKQWKENQRKHRAEAKRIRAVLDLTPDSFEEPLEENIERPSPAEPTHQPRSQPEPPLAFSTPKENKEKLSNRCKRLKKLNLKLRKQLFQLKKTTSPS